MTQPILTQLESPFAGSNSLHAATNLAYARQAMHDSLRRGEAPFASHLLYTQSLDDDIPADRELGIQAGFAFYQHVKQCVVYIDIGISGGMRRGIEQAYERGLPVFYRRLFPAMPERPTHSSTIA